MTRPWQSIIAAFRDSAEAFADRPALHAADGIVWTYAQVLEAVEQLAGRLSPHIRAPEAIVALVLPRSVDWVLGAIANWWLGAAFTPLDPTLPADRLDFLLNDASPVVVLTTAERTFSFAAMGLPVVTCPYTPLPSTRIRPIPLRPDSLAYRIYTSGSTGRPKGVDVEHRGLTPLLSAQIEAFDLRPGDRVLWLLSPAFDAALSDIFTTLLAGATLFIEPEDELRDPEGLIRILHQYSITHLDLPPSLLRVLDPANLPSSLRTLIVGGEASLPETFRRWARHFRLVNVYGPTEATICSSLCVCDPEQWNEPLLGRPLPGVRYHVLDADCQLLARGNSGELAIAGSGLARGYHRRDELTARKFVVGNDERLYRTGDRVLWREDGEYVFLGRLDRQVKIHGQLVEPEEIERALQMLPQVRQASVLKRPLGQGVVERAELVAFFTAEEPAPTSVLLRAHLNARLPRWMIPVKYVRLTTLPRTVSGKIDLTALAALPIHDEDTEHTEPEAVSIAARELGALLKYFLGVPHINWQVSFWELGGDSLTLLRIAQAAHARNLKLSPARLAEVHRLVDLITDGEASAEDVTAGAMRADDIRRDVAAVLADLRLPITIPVARTVDHPTCLLLTGATGFLGSYLLGEFVLHSASRIVCLVRASSPELGRSRLMEAQPADRRPIVAAAANRIEVVCGDLAVPHLGLDTGSWSKLADEIDAIVHNAAWVHLLHAYATLRATNLVGTGEIIRLQADSRGARLHHVSTLSVFVGSDRAAGRFFEDDDLRRTAWVHGGYAQSKWAAEYLVHQAQQRFGPSDVYRPGLVTGDSHTGFAPDNDFLGLFLRGLARLRCFPEVDAEQMCFDVTPVEYAASALAFLALHAPPDPKGRAFHLAGRRPASLSELLDAMRAVGVTIETVDWPTWRRRLTELEYTSPETAAACMALGRAMPDPIEAACYRTLDLFPAGAAMFDQARTDAALAGSGIACPPPSADLLQRYVAFALRDAP